jgi:HEAT repeat protein
MGKSKSTSQKLAELNAQCAEPKSADSIGALRAALQDRSNYLAKKAAEIIEAAKLDELIPELRAAFERLAIEPEKSDAGCLGKTAVMQALVNLGHDDVEFYRRGIKCRQPEGVWGGERDSADGLRAAAAAGLAGWARVLDALSEFADLLVDREKQARIGAARAIAQMNCPDGIPLLRLKLLTGDKDPEVLGECSSALLKLAAEAGIPYVARLLTSVDPDLCIQAALALGESRQAEAFEPLRQCWERQADASTKAILLTCIGLLRRTEAIKFLISLISRQDLDTAVGAIRALAPLRSADEVRREVEAVAISSGSARLIEVFKAEFH